MNQIKMNTLLLIQELFAKKGWELREGNSINLSLYDRFCERLKLFSNEQQLLIIELTYFFSRVELSIYLEKFYESLICLGDTIFNSYEKIFVYPLLSPFKAIPSKTKSAGFLHYMFESDEYRWLSQKFIPNHSIDYLKRNFSNHNSILILVDDFVGSGETAISICNEFLSVKVKDEIIDSNNIKVVTIAAQKQGVDALKKEINIDVVSAMIFERGISDRYLGIEKEKRIDLMTEIEKSLRIQKDFRLGYKQSEALVSLLNKTPNNTFPVYWHETNSKVAPFPRKKKFINNG